MLTGERAGRLAAEEPQESWIAGVPNRSPTSAFEQLSLPIEGLHSVGAPRPSQRQRPSGQAAFNVAAFHRAFELPRRTTPGVDGISDDLLRLRERLLDEETAEFAVASHRR